MQVKFDNDMKVPAKCWLPLEEIEDSCIEQIKNLSNLPFLHKHIAIMPDCHTGYGMPIGSIIATKDVVIPNAVGVDIGCGMRAVKTSLKAEELDANILKAILRQIRGLVPVGFAHHKQEQDEKYMPVASSGYSDSVYSKEYKSALKQIGTLGGGNHFIEIQKDEDKNVWFMIHTGSRNLGYKVADYYNKKAIELNEKWHSKVGKSWQLNFLPIDDTNTLGRDYLIEMDYCVTFAMFNRKLIAENIINAFIDVLPNISIRFDDPIDCIHNYASLENHFNENVWVHRKGATLARDGELGIIPGSQGTCSYIVRGRGNQESFNSCSHGAGRRMGRKQAIKNLDLEAEKKLLDDKNIIHSIRSKHDLEEAPSAYKNIEDVINYQKDLIEVAHKLEPLAVIKG